MATEITSSLIPASAVPVDARTVVANAAALADVQNPYIGLEIYLVDTGKKVRVTALTSKTIGALTVPNAAIGEYEEIGSGIDADAVLEVVTSGGFVTSDALTSGGFVTSDALTSGGFVTSDALTSGGFVTSDALTSGGFVTSDALTSGGFVTSDALASGGFVTSDALASAIGQFESSATSLIGE